MVFMDPRVSFDPTVSLDPKISWDSRVSSDQRVSLDPWVYFDCLNPRFHLYLSFLLDSSFPGTKGLPNQKCLFELRRPAGSKFLHLVKVNLATNRLL